MPQTQIHGNKQIQAGTILDANIAAAAGILSTKLADGANFLQKNGSVAMISNLDFGTNKGVNLADPVNPQDAATRAWVLSQLTQSVSSALTARAATTANIALSNVQTIDGVSLAANDLCLVKNQTTQSENGLYKVVSGGAWQRAAGMDTWAEVPGTMISIQEGTTNHDTIWLSAADAGGTLGTTTITFVQIPGPSDIQAGAGMTRTGQALDVVAADNSLLVNADNMQVRLDAVRCITVGATGIGVNIQTTTMQQVTNLLGVKLDGAGAIVAGSPGIAINYDSATLQIVSNILAVKANLYIAASNYIIRETPSGTIDGSNVTFVLASPPNPANTEAVFLNGILQEPGGGNDYTISGATITMAQAPPSGSRLKVNYINRAISPT